jgi:hypothetical protein
VHNAHLNQGYGVVRYWCARALENWPESAEIMTRLIDYQTRRAPAIACRSAIELFELDKLGTLEYLSRPGQQRLDLVLGDAIVDSLLARGVELGPRLSKLRRDEHSTKTGPKELTDLRYSSAIPGRWPDAWTSRSFPMNYGSHALYASAFSQISRFVFFGEQGQAVGLKLTYRVPAASGQHCVVGVDVNGHTIVQAQTRAGWQTLEVIVSGDRVVEGMNEIAVIWPEGNRRSELLLEQAADALGARRLPYVYEVFGEIHSLSVSDRSASPS